MKFLRYRPVLDNEHLKDSVSASCRKKTSAEAFEVLRAGDEV